MQFEELVEKGIEALPLWVRHKLDNVAFLIKDAPTKAQSQGLTSGETLFGLYEGVPLSDRGNEPIFLPDTITIFKQPILEAYQKEEDIKACVENTIWHEVAHYFGHDEEWVEAEERRRGKQT